MKEKTYIKPKLDIMIDIINDSDNRNDGAMVLNNGDIWGDTSGGGHEGGLDE
jgi:hypothetical protein